MVKKKHSNGIVVVPEKKVLANGLTVLVRSCHHIPRVEAHLLYHVGAKDEPCDKKGIAHVIEHMLFKGTAALSETDINVITHKLTGVANAFTSQDYTGYTFRLPRAHWEVALQVFAECMQSARFDEQMLASELQAIVEELRMYKDDYASYLYDLLFAALWPEHPYGVPVIGRHASICSLTHDDLFDFYHQHYHPKNATLVVVGDVQAEAVFDAAQRLLGNIPAPAAYTKKSIPLFSDLVTREVTLYRPVSIPWVCFLYVVPGAEAGVNVIFDIATLILGNGKSSRLYRRLVEQEGIALDVECSLVSFFQAGVLSISVYPKSKEDIERIWALITQEIERLSHDGVEDWELQGARKKALFDYSALLESFEKQASLIGTAYLATQKTTFLQDYFDQLDALKSDDITQFVTSYLCQGYACRGVLLPCNDRHAVLEKMQAEQLAHEDALSATLIRTSPIEPVKFADTLVYGKHAEFSFPKPETFTLDNGLEVVYYHNTLAPNVAVMLKCKGSSLYDLPGKEGCFLFLLRLLTDCSADYGSQELSTLLEQNGLYIGASGDYLSGLSLGVDSAALLEMMAHLLTRPSFSHENIEKIRAQILHELHDYWDTPIVFVDQVVKSLVYGDHPYGKPSEGTKESIAALTVQDLQDCFTRLISPQGSILVVVGDVDRTRIKQQLNASFGVWRGPVVESFIFPPLVLQPPCDKKIVVSRDQVALAFAAPSIARLDADFHALALLDIIFTGGAQSSSNSRLFELREQHGLFYAIGGSLLHGAQEAPGLAFIKTLVSPEKTKSATEIIFGALELLEKKGVTKEEFLMAKDVAISSSVELFENNLNIAQTFLFLKRFNLNFNLFDKQPSLLSILKLEDVNERAKQYCKRSRFWTVTIGRTI